MTAFHGDTAAEFVETAFDHRPARRNRRGLGFGPFEDARHEREGLRVAFADVHRRPGRRRRSRLREQDRELLRKCEGGTFGPREEVAHLGRADQRVGVLESQVRAEQCVQCEHTIDVEMIVDDELGLDVIGIGDVSQADLGGAVGLVARIRLVRYPMAELDVAVTANAARICTVGEDDTVRSRARMVGADDVEAIGHGGGHAVRLRPQPHSRSTAPPGQPVVCAYRGRRGVPLRRMRLHLRLDVRAGHVRRVCRASRRPRRVARGRTGGRRAPEASTRGVVCARIRMSRPGCAARAARPGAVGPPGGRSGAPADGSGRTSLHDGYAEQHPADVARQLVDAASLFARDLDRLDRASWQRGIVYGYPPPPRRRTLEWVAVHTVHELRHHLQDARASATGEPRKYTRVDLPP